MGYCGCSTSLACCSPKKAVQDKVCIDWTISHTTGTDTIRVIYDTNVGNIIASGYFKFISAPLAADTVTLTFLNGAATVEEITAITAGEVKSFTVQNFDSVQITVPLASSTGVYIGEFCLTPRYKI